MPGNEATEFGRAEAKARLAVIRAEKKAAAEAAKPKVVATVSPKMAEAIKHDPGEPAP